MDNTQEKATPKKSNKLLIALLIILAILGTIYGVGAYYFSSHFLLNIYINDEKVGNMTLSEAEKVFTEDYDSHTITLVEKERQETINPKDISVVISVGNRISDLLESQNYFLWFLGLNGEDKKTVALDVTYDEDALKKTVDGLECFKKENVTAPKSAYIKAGETQFEAVPEVLGNTVKKKELIKTIGEYLATCKTTINLEDEDLYKLPTVYTTNPKLQAGLTKANKYAKSKITYDFEYTTVVVDYNKFKDWINIGKKFEVSFDDDKVSSYVDKLCRDFNTMGTARKFTTANGNEITITQGDYGWKIYYDKELEKLTKNLKSGKEVTRKPIYSYEAQCYDGPNDDIGDSYVEVSISNQMVYLFIDGECILSSDVVTGDTTKGRGTTPGVYSITYKQRNATLSGQGYSSPVSYWMPFNGNQGLHDASWRGSFGGSIYKGNGSHGCVNCPSGTAATLYKYVDTGFPVVVH